MEDAKLAAKGIVVPLNLHYPYLKSIEADSEWSCELL